MAAGPGSECEAGRETRRGASGGGAGEEKGQGNGPKRTERLRKTHPGITSGGAGWGGPNGSGKGGAKKSERGGASSGSRGFESRCARALPPLTPALSRRAQAAERRPHRALVHPREALPGLLRHAQRRPELVRERGRRAAMCRAAGHGAGLSRCCLCSEQRGVQGVPGHFVAFELLCKSRGVLIKVKRGESWRGALIKDTECQAKGEWLGLREGRFGKCPCQW